MNDTTRRKLSEAIQRWARQDVGVELHPEWEKNATEIIREFFEEEEKRALTCCFCLRKNDTLEELKEHCRVCVQHPMKQAADEAHQSAVKSGILLAAQIAKNQELEVQRTDMFDTAGALVAAMCGEDLTTNAGIDAAERKLNAVGPKPSDFARELRRQAYLLIATLVDVHAEANRCGDNPPVSGCCWIGNVVGPALSKLGPTYLGPVIPDTQETPNDQ